MVRLLINFTYFDSDLKVWIISMSNEATKAQIRSWLENAVRRAKNPDPREKMLRDRQKKRDKVLKNFGL